MNKGRWAVLLAVVLLTAACGASTGGTTARSSAKLLSTAEINASSYSDAFSLVQSLRPQWLRSRGASSMRSSEAVKVYLDGSLLGGPEYLRQITTASVGTIQHLDGLEATQRWGLDHGAGAILVVTRIRQIERQP